MYFIIYLSIKLYGHKDTNQLGEQMLSEGYEFIWAPAKISQYLSYGKIMGTFGIKVTYSRIIGMLSPNTIITKILPGTAPEFVYFRCFSTLTWILIFVSILLMSIIHLIRIRVTSSTRVTISTKYQVKLFLETIINNICPLLSKAVDNNQAEHSTKLGLGVYLLFSMVISFNFSNYLLDYLQVELPMVKIKTLEDITKRNDLKILMRHDSSLVAFAEKGDSELARNIKDKLEVYFDFHRENIVTNLTNGLIEGSIAYIQEYFNAVQTLPRINKINKLFSMDNLHISTESAGYEPYFILVNPDISIWASMYLDKT